MSEQTFPDALTQVVVFKGQRPLDLHEARKISTAFAEANKTKCVAILRVFASERDFSCFGVGATAAHPTYEAWAKKFATCNFEPGAIAEAVVLAGAAVMRYRDEHGDTYREVLFNHDPLRWTIEGQPTEILQIQVHRGPNDKNNRDLWTLVLFVRSTGQPSSAFGEKVLNDLDGLTGLNGQSMIIEIRPNSWFLADVSFPTRFPFEKHWLPPEPDTYRSQPRISCLRLRGSTNSTACVNVPSK
jgi:hypothetical protein